MDEVKNMEQSKHNDSHYIKIRKEVFGSVLILAMICLGAYQMNDWWSHMNWPPFDGSNREAIASLGCTEKFPLNKKEISKWGVGVNTDSMIDRRNFFIQPQCASAGTYLFFEGSGTRHSFDVVDVEKKRRTARIEITFERDERALK